MQRFGKLLFFLLLILLVLWLWPAGELRHPPGVLAPGEPLQTALTPAPLGEIHGFRLTAVALYEITARILHTKRYRTGPASRLVPFDVAVGWGPMSDQAILDQLDISQSNRFFFYSWDDAPPLDPSVIGNHASNMHLIAANAGVGKTIGKLRNGSVVSMAGYLVNASTSDGFQWKTSLSRTDNGNGACELFYVTAIQVMSDRSDQ